MARYDEAVAAAPGREVGLFYNPHTGEFAVQIGTEADLPAPRGDGWHAVIHLHPNPENVVLRRLPAPADILGAVQAATRSGSHVEFVQSGRPDGSTGIARVVATHDPPCIVVEAPAEPGEPARRIEVNSPEEYARTYDRETTSMGPTDPLYEWVVRDLVEYYTARRAGRSHGAGSGRTASGLALNAVNVTSAATAAGTVEPDFRERLSAGRGDVAERFAAAGMVHAKSGAQGLAPAEQFDASIRVLAEWGLDAPGRALIAEMFEPAAGTAVLSERRFRRTLELLSQISELVLERPDLLTASGRRPVYNSVRDIARDIDQAYRSGKTLEGRRIRGADSPELREAMQAMQQAFTDQQNTASGDPIERLMALLRLRDQIVRAAEILRSYDLAFTSSTTTGIVTTSDMVKGIYERSIKVTADGRVGEPLARNLPGVGLERYMLTARDLGELSTNPPGLAGRLAHLLRGYHRAHLIGPGFGGEMFEGMMLAPAGVNLEAQNEGVEHFIRQVRQIGVEPSLTACASGQQLIVRLAGGGVEHVDVLRRVEYVITGTLGGRDPVTHRVVIDISAPPDGRPKITTNTIPANAPGGDVLARLSAAS